MNPDIIKIIEECRQQIEKRKIRLKAIQSKKPERGGSNSHYLLDVNAMFTEEEIITSFITEKNNFNGFKLLKFHNGTFIQHESKEKLDELLELYRLTNSDPAGMRWTPDQEVIEYRINTLSELIKLNEILNEEKE